MEAARPTTLWHVADLRAVPGPQDANYEEVSALVLERLRACDENSMLADPHSAMLRIAREVAEQWSGVALGEAGGSDDAPDRSALLKRALASLNPECRDALAASVSRDLNYRQVAELLGLPPDEALARLRTAYCQLRQSL
jgi:hypothetical protein